MRIDGPQRFGTATNVGRSRQSDGTGPRFEIGQPAKPADAHPPTPPTALGGLDALLAVQVAGDALQSRRKGVRRGRAMVDALDELKLALLAGRVPAAALDRLVGSVEGRERDTGDHRLESLLDEIELRARVELAKLRAA
jgi:hypothetical protein